MGAPLGGLGGAYRDVSVAPTPSAYAPSSPAVNPPLHPLGGCAAACSSAVAASPALPTGGGSPGGGEASAAAVVDGKDFFRQARLRLTYEQFNQFLSNIKRLNDHAQTRDETLARAQDIFGQEGGDLFVAFKTLLSKHGLA
jgi:hypothetical protein